MLAMIHRTWPGILCSILVLLCPCVASGELTVSLSEDLSGVPGQDVVSRLSIHETDPGSNPLPLIESLQFDVSYDPAVLDFVSATNGTVLSNAGATDPVVNDDIPGIAQVSIMFSTNGVTPPNNSVLVELRFTIRLDAVSNPKALWLDDVMIGEDAILVTDGDINNDNQVNIIDVLLASRFSLGLDTPSIIEGELARGNVAPLVSGTPTPADNQIGVDDLLLIQKKALTGTFY